MFTGRLILVCLLFLSLAVLVRTAWVCDDAYITLRVADNFIHGYGLRWNVDERVAAFTHPLWLFVFSVLYAATREAYYTVIWLGIGITLITMSGLAFRVGPPATAALALVALLTSKAFIDFSTSGLENSLTNLLILLFVLEWARQDRRRHLLRLWGLAALALLNRLDLACLLAPALAAATVSYARRVGARQAAGEALLGMLPLIAWEGFSILYFGFPFPNTAYAKLATGVPAAALMRQGLYYFDLGFWFDPVTVLVIALAPVALAFRGSRGDWPLVAGVLLACLYVMRVGGDFMYGRFLAAPFLMSLLVMQRAARRLSWLQAAVAAAIFLAVGLTAPYQPSLLANAHFGARDPVNKNLDIRGVHDERRWYYPQTGLFRQETGALHPNHPWAYDGLNFRDRGTAVVVRGNIGFVGYFAGPGVHIIDPYALADPLLARLPAVPNSRIGHFRRDMPEGYAESVRDGYVRISDPSLAEYYRRLRLVVAGPLFSGARLKTILELNLGRFDFLVDEYTKAHVR